MSHLGQEAMKKQLCVLFRVDAGRRLGNGHLMRCLALGKSLRSMGIRVVFVSRIESIDLKKRLRKEKISLVPMTRRRPGGENDARDTNDVARKWNASWIVVDGHQFTPSYQRRLVGGAHRLMLIDDHGGAPSAADIILNQNLHARRALYVRAKKSILLLGPRHILLRSEFIAWRRWKRPIAVVGKRILITMGGSDSENATAKALQAVASLDLPLDIVVVLGEHYPYSKRLAALARNVPHRVRIIKGTDRMAALMAWADLGISTFGTTSWELAYMGLPAVSLVVEAHQKTFAQAMARYGAIVKLDERDPFPAGFLRDAVNQALQSPQSRKKMSRRGRALVDGLGNRRVLSAMGLSGKSRPKT